MRVRKSIAAGLVAGLVGLFSGCIATTEKQSLIAQRFSIITSSAPATNVYQVVITGSIEDRFRADTEMANATAELAGIPLENRILLEKEKGPLHALDGYEPLPRYISDGCANRDQINKALKSVVDRSTESDLVLLYMIGHGTQVTTNGKTESALCIFGSGDEQAVTGNDAYTASELVENIKNCRAAIFFCTGACYGGGLARQVRWNVRRSFAVSACGDNEIARTDIGASFVTSVISALHKRSEDKNRDGVVDLFEAYKAGFRIDRSNYAPHGYLPGFFFSGIDPLKTYFSAEKGWVITSEQTLITSRAPSHPRETGK